MVPMVSALERFHCITFSESTISLQTQSTWSAWYLNSRKTYHKHPSWKLLHQPICFDKHIFSDDIHLRMLDHHCHRHDYTQVCMVLHMDLLSLKLKSISYIHLWFFFTTVSISIFYATIFPRDCNPSAFCQHSNFVIPQPFGYPYYHYHSHDATNFCMHS